MLDLGDRREELAKKLTSIDLQRPLGSALCTCRLTVAAETAGKLIPSCKDRIFHWIAKALSRGRGRMRCF